MRANPWLFYPAAIVAALSGTWLKADELGNFYAKREVSLIVGTGAGGGYDTFGRLVGRFLGNHIPGNPNFVVQFMPGASGVKAVNYLYAIAPKDGSVISIFNANMPLYELIGQPGIQFKCQDLSWIGSISKDIQTLVVWHTAGVKTIEEAKQTPMILGATGAGGMKAGFGDLLNGSVGTKFKVVTGYEGGNTVNLAMERGEVHGNISSWGSLEATRPEWVAERKVVPLVQVSLERGPGALKDTPLLTELATNDEQRQLFYLLSVASEMARPFAGPPGHPPVRLAALRKGFAALQKDEAFLAAAAKQKVTIDSLSGAELSDMVSRIMFTPPELIAKNKSLFRP